MRIESTHVGYELSEMFLYVAAQFKCMMINQAAGLAMTLRI